MAPAPNWFDEWKEGFKWTDIFSKLSMLSLLLAVGLIVGHYYAPKLLLVSLFITLGLLSRVPKLKVADVFTLTDCTEFFIGYTLLTMGFAYSLLANTAINFLPQLVMKERTEGPDDAILRIVLFQSVAIVFWAILAYTAMPHLLAFKIFMAIAIAMFPFANYVIFHIYNPVYAVVALAKFLLFLNVLNLAAVQALLGFA